jgi:hypothetical protein
MGFQVTTVSAAKQSDAIMRMRDVMVVFMSVCSSADPEACASK